MRKIAAVILSLSASSAFADLVVPMNQVDSTGVGASAGQITISESKYGVVLTPALNGISPGMHGFHLHQNGSCDAQEKDGKMVAAAAAGGHYDPAATKMHGTPWGEGHLGDLPPLYVAEDGSASQPVLAPRLKLEDVQNRALMIHAGGDNHSDHPASLGGGGARVVCGVAK